MICVIICRKGRQVNAAGTLIGVEISVKTSELNPTLVLETHIKLLIV